MGRSVRCSLPSQLLEWSRAPFRGVVISLGNYDTSERSYEYRTRRSRLVRLSCIDTEYTFLRESAKIPDLGWRGRTVEHKL